MHYRNRAAVDDLPTHEALIRGLMTEALEEGRRKGAANKRLHPTRTAALLPRGAILQRVAVRAGEPQIR